MVEQSADPFGSRPSPRRFGWAGVVVGLLLVLGGIAATIAGIAGAVDSFGAIEDDAVGRATVRAGEVRDTVTFEVPPGDRRHYTVWVLFDGLTSNSDIRELAVRDTGCAAVLPDGVETRFRGARQGTSVTIGDASTVGHFSSQPGRVEVRCAYITGTLRSERQRPDALPYVVSPGKPSGADTLTILGGVFGALAGGLVFFLGWRRRRG